MDSLLRITKLRGPAADVARMLTRQALITHRHINHEDDGLLRALFESSRDELELLPTDVRYVLIDMQYRAQRRYLAATYPTARQVILVVDGTDVGRLVLDDSGAAVRVIDITVLRAYRGRHIATTTLTDVVDDARREGRATEVVIWTGNTAGRARCASVGFEVQSEADGYLTMVCA